MAPSASSARELRTLRLRITGLITLLATAVVLVFAVVAIRVDAQLRDEQVEATLLRSTTRAAGLVGFGEDGLDLDSNDTAVFGDDVVIGVRPEFDVFAVVEAAGTWDEVPQMSDAEADERIDDLVADFDSEEMAELLDLEEPIAADAMRERLLETRTDELYDEAYRGFLFDQADADGIELTMPTEVFGSASNPLSEADALVAIERVADDDEDAVFDVANGALKARGVPLREGAEIRGAIVAVVDPGDGASDHSTFRRSIIGLGIGLVIASAAAAWFVAGRTVRPAGRALAQQERFLADAAHELRTPIAAIRATAESHASDPSGAALARVAELAGGAAQLTDDLLTLARMDADRMTVQRQRVRLDLLVEALIDEDRAFTFIAEDEVVVDVDPSLVERAVDNLLRNAHSHGAATANNPAEVRVTRGGEVIVHDQGPGIDPELIDSVFDRFRSDASSSGHGLGLALCRWIARAHGGDCTLTPEVTSGARFTLWFGER